MKRNKLIYSMIAATTLFAASCTDFDDYNEAYTDSHPMGNATIWENIAADENLSQFAEILKSVGYDKELQNSRTYTVWAPLNDTYDYQSFLNQENKDELIKRFVNSHVANYTYPLTSTLDEKIHTLNNKSFDLIGDGSNYTYADNKIVEKNIPTLNGLLHTIDGYAQFFPNIYEYLFSVGKDDVKEVPSIFEKYQSEELDVSQSVEGPIDADGNQTYIEKVMITTNSLLDSDYLNAKLLNEDSSYTMLIPTDEAYTIAFEKIKKCFNYAEETEYWTPTREVPAPAAPIKETTTEGMPDSLVTRNILTNTVFNNNNKYNRWVENPKDEYKSDTLCTTRGVKLSNGAELISDQYLVEDGLQKMSNGYSRIVNDLPILPWETYNREISIPLFGSDGRSNRPLVEGIQGEEPESRSISWTGKDGQDRLARFIDLIPTQESANPRAYFYIPNVRSTTYNIYVAVVPSGFVDTQIVEEEGVESVKPYERSYKFEVALNYAEADGKVKLGDGGRPFYNGFKQWAKTIETEASIEDFTEAREIVDTILVGQVTFPVSYYGLTNCKPMLRIEGKRSSWNKNEWTKIDNRLRINAIILRPVDYDEYLNKGEDEE